MTGYAGIDRSEFLGDAELTELRASSNLSWCGYYLAPAPSHGDTSWMGRRAALEAAGWGLEPIYVGQQLTGRRSSHDVTGPRGAADGRDAVSLMSAEGFAPGAFVFLDLEDGAPFTAPRTDYVATWTAAVRAGGYGGGVYCSHDLAIDVHVSDPAIRIWAFRVTTTQTHPFPGLNFPTSDPAGCGYPGAFAWQLGQNCQVTLTAGANPTPIVDISTAVAPNPSAP